MKKNLSVDFTQSPNFPTLEEKVLEYWDQVNAFNRSVTERPKSKPFVFYDGPPFATGLPHYGHLLGSIMKDIIPRYWTMKGYRVERVWGWDCHGLPIENIIETELGLTQGKKDIEKFGIDKFNAACRSAIFRFDAEWEKVIRRIGRWVDFKNSYKTMDTNFMESVWWAFKTLYEKDLIYQGRKVILYCPRCSTPLSNFEIAMDNSYKDVEDNSVFIKFKLADKKNTYALAWTTTPWTLIGNVGLAVHPDQTYAEVTIGQEHYILAQQRLDILNTEYQIIRTFKGSELENLNYEPLYPYLDIDAKQAHYIATADFVSMDEGTGIVHTAAMYGEDDFKLALALDLPLVDMLDEQGKFLDFVTPVKGMFFKKAEKWVIEDLVQRELMFKHEKYIHSYPHCYRCDTPLYYTGIPAWFINIQKLKPELVKHNQAINWYPSHLKAGRFGKGLETAPDWNISRSRYWGTPIPIWQSQKTDETGVSEAQCRIIGSIEELKKWAVDPSRVEHLTDIHREHIDDIEVYIDDAKTIKGTRIPEVFDCWVESGSMPYASEHYPFENKQKFESRHPAQFISEYIAQTRAWFYTLHVMSVGLFESHTFENALTTGTIMAADGSKMSKSKRNFTDPMILVDKYGVDSLRLYFASSPVMKTAENVNFSEKHVDEIRKKVFNIFWNVFSFYTLYDDGSHNFKLPDEPTHVLDKWLITRLISLDRTVTQAMDAYDVVSASRALIEFVDEFSTWWLRLSRERLKAKSTNSQALQVFRATLLHWSLLMAPIAPFFTELVYQNLVHAGLDSIHLEQFSKDTFTGITTHQNLEVQTKEVRKAIEKIHSSRKACGLKLRQPLTSAIVTSTLSQPDSELLEVMAAEVNVKKILWQSGKQLEIELDTKITKDLLREGQAREIIRQIQGVRKKMGLKVEDHINIILPQWPKEYELLIKEKVGAVSIAQGQHLEIQPL